MAYDSAFSSYNVAAFPSLSRAQVPVFKITTEDSSIEFSVTGIDRKLKSKDFFNAKQDPKITFLPKEIVQAGPTTFDLQGDFTIRGALIRRGGQANGRFMGPWCSTEGLRDE